MSKKKYTSPGTTTEKEVGPGEMNAAIYSVEKMYANIYNMINIIYSLDHIVKIQTE